VTSAALPGAGAGFEAALERVHACTTPVFFVGTHKNSGKTTAFLRFARALRERDVPLILCSLGRDGEARDQLFGHEKPLVRVEPGWRFVTHGAALADVPCDLVAPLPAVVDGRTLGLFEARACGEIELWGPPAASALRRVLDACTGFLVGGRAPTLLVDGALDRRAALYHGPSGMILCCKGGAFAGPAALSAHLALRRRLFDAPRLQGPAPPVRVADSAGDLPEGLDAVVVDGPLTQSLATDLLALGHPLRRIVVTSPLHVFAEASTLSRLVDRLVVMDAPAWLGTAVNPAGAGGAAPDPAALLAGARAALGQDHPLFDVLSVG